MAKYVPVFPLFKKFLLENEKVCKTMLYQFKFVKSFQTESVFEDGFLCRLSVKLLLKFCWKLNVFIYWTYANAF